MSIMEQTPVQRVILAPLDSRPLMLGPGNGHTEYSLRMLLGDEHLGATNSSFQRTAQVEKPRTAPLLLCPVAAVGVQELPLGGRAFSVFPHAGFPPCRFRFPGVPVLRSIMCLGHIYSKHPSSN